MENSIPRGDKQRLYLLWQKQEAILKQKVRIQWLNLGDQNTTYFHRLVKARQSRNTIRVLFNDCGVQLENIQDMKEEAVNYFKRLLGPDGQMVNTSQPP